LSAKEPPDKFSDDDRTVLIPSPGGRRIAPTQPQPAQPAPTDDATMLILPTRTAAPAAPTAPTAQPAVALLHGRGLNTLVRAANPLLDLVTPLRQVRSNPDVEFVRVRLVAAVKQFELDARAAQVEHEALAAARYCLCTLLDETISSTPWGGGGIWASRSLLVAFHNEASGGEKFFLILQKLSQNPQANLSVLELMYLCLALGLEGRYRVIENGRALLESVRERLQQLIQTQHGGFEPALSPNWRGASGKGEPLWRVIPVWVLAAGAAVLCLLLQVGLSLYLSQLSDPVFGNLHRIKLALAAPAALPAAFATATPAAAAPTAAPVRLRAVLAADIDRGFVSVAETAQRSVVTLRGDSIFASGSAEVDSDFLALLGRIGDALKTVPGKVIVIGHTDNTKGRFSVRFPSNWDLSKGRAQAVTALLAGRAGPLERYGVEGRGDTDPLVANDNAANRALNRRVDIILLVP
jgi:type VI secretion system protein ImpK